MPEHVKEWLSAYSDGELRGNRLRQVENHLGKCPECLAELEQLQSLSNLLHEAIPTGDFMMTERFVAKLTLNLPRRSEAPHLHKALEIGWWLIPFVLLGAWTFLQVTFALSWLTQNVWDAGLLGSAFPWLQFNPPQAEWFSTLINLFGSQPGFIDQTLLQVLNNANLVIEDWLGSILWQALLAVIYFGWAASWWLKQTNQLSQPENIQTFAQ